MGLQNLEAADHCAIVEETFVNVSTLRVYDIISDKIDIGYIIIFKL